MIRRISFSTFTRLALLSLFAVSVGCSGSDKNSGQCSKDADCHGELVCSPDNLCKSPDEAGKSVDSTDDTGRETDTSQPDTTTSEGELTVDAEASVSSGKAPLKVDFSADAAINNSSGSGALPDELELEYKWDFQTDANGIPTETGKKPTYTYSVEGEYTAQVNVTEVLKKESNGREPRKATDTVTIDVSPAEFSVSANASETDVTTDTEIDFECSASSELSADQFRYEWTFESLGASSGKRDWTKSFSETGTYTATCTVTSPGGETTKEDSVTVTVQENPVPEIKDITASPRMGAAPLEVNFSADVEYDGDPSALTYQWYIDSPIGNSQDQTLSHEKGFSWTFVFGQIASDRFSKKIVLKVSDARSQQMEVRKESVTVRVGKEEIPSVVITQPEQEDIQGSEPLTVDFDTDIFGGEPPVDVSWEFGDGTTSSKPSPTHTYNYSASYRSYKATVTVTDSDGTEHSDSVSIKVTED